LWPSYEGANNWKIVTLVPKKEADKKVARESLHCILNAIVAHMSLMMREGHVGAVGLTDEAAMGYTTLSSSSASRTPSKRIQRECLGSFPPDPWWLMGFTSTGYNEQHSGTHHLLTQLSWR
jgi:hypothetical protein